MTKINPADIQVGDRVDGLGGVVEAVSPSLAEVKFDGADRMTTLDHDDLAHATITRPSAAPAAEGATWTDADRAIVEEAKRLARKAGAIVSEILPHGILWDIARLAREGWLPPPAVDPDVLIVREIVATAYDADGSTRYANTVRSGDYDPTPTMQRALTALRKGRKLERARGDALAQAVEAYGVNSSDIRDAVATYRAASTKGEE